MPQLVVTDYMPQLVWLAVTFVLLYVLMSRLLLPKVGGVLAERDRYIEDELGRAERLKAETDEALQNYDMALRKARAEAQSRHREAAAAISAVSAQREQAFAAELAERTRSAEQSIEAAKQAALKTLPQIATEVASSAVQRLTNKPPATDRINAAVASVLNGGD
jgi:F-type H+-transporting ATPase subunit b